MSGMSLGGITAGDFSRHNKRLPSSMSERNILPLRDGLLVVSGRIDAF
jgi:hypothetical protein